MFYTRLFGIATSVILVSCQATQIQAAILASGFSTGTIVSFDEANFAQSTFASVVLNPAAGRAGLSGITYGNDRVYVTEIDQFGFAGGRIHSFNLSGGNEIVTQLAPGFEPAGIVVRADGRVYVSNLFDNTVKVFDSTLTTLQQTITGIGGGSTSGVGFSGSNLIISTLGQGVFTYDGTTVTPFNSQFAAAGQVAVDSSGNVYVGHGLGITDSVYKFNSLGTELNAAGQPGSPFLSVSDSMVNGTGNSTDPAVAGTAPSGVFVDANGDLIVAVLGKTKNTDVGGERGGVFKFNSTNGALEQILIAGSMAFSGVTIAPTAVPEPNSLALLAIGGLVVTAFRKRKHRRLNALGSVDSNLCDI